MICEYVGKWLKLSINIGVKVCESVCMKVVAAGISGEVGVGYLRVTSFVCSDRGRAMVNSYQPPP